VRFFDPSNYLAARNELAFINQAGDVGRIDRLVEFDTEIWVLDYKTGEADILLEPAQLIARHRGQLEEYARAASALWPGKPVHAGLVLASGRLIPL
jgi:ATP-dependent helicase/nuclease subunit A